LVCGGWIIASGASLAVAQQATSDLPRGVAPPLDPVVPPSVRAPAGEEARASRFPRRDETPEGAGVARGGDPAGGRGPDEGEATGPGASSATSANPAAVDITVGTGALGRLLGLGEDSGIRLGGAWIGDANWLITGGVRPGHWTLNSLTLLDLTLDAEKLLGIEGGSFGIDFLQFSGQPTNSDAGVVQGYNSLVGPPPLTRQELYELYYRQSFLDDRLVVRVGKTVPTYDFNNVSRPVTTDDPAASIPSVSGLIYTPLFVNPTILGKIPGYYNSATGVTARLAPTERTYFTYGGFDGSLATGEQTGLRGPQFNGHYFHIWEIGRSWMLGPRRKPGNFGVGLWYQSGALTAPDGRTVHGAQGVYLFGAQRLWFRRPGVDNSGISGFYQYGANNSNTMFARQFFGCGLTGFGLVPGRPDDSLGCGLAWSWLNDDPNAGQFFFPGVPGRSTRLRGDELMLQSYYQLLLRDGAYLQPALTYVPNPAERPGIRDAWALTIRLIFLF
jgi:porin